MLLSEAIHTALDQSLLDPNVLLLGQLVRYGHSSLTRGLEKKYPDQVITFPVCENLMNASAMGLAMAGKRPVVLHERFDFAMVGMSPLVNEIPLYKGKLPIVFLMIVGHGKGQGPQQSKDFTHCFKGWNITVMKERDGHHPMELKHAIFGDSPHMFVIPRQLYD